MRTTHKWERRDAKRKKKKYGMKMSGRSLFILERIKQKRAEKLKERRNASQHKTT